MEKEEILRRTNGGLDVFRHYISGNWRVGKNFLNPFYKDTKASMHVYYDRHNGIYRMKDFGDGRYSGDCFTLVGLLNGWNCTQAQDFVCIMAKIAHDLNLQVDTCPMTATATGCKTLENTATAPANENGNKSKRAGENKNENKSKTGSDNKNENKNETISENESKKPGVEALSENNQRNDPQYGKRTDIPVPVL